MRLKIKYILIVLTVIVMNSCQREHLYYGSNDTAGIKIDLNWNKSQLSPNGATIAAFREDGTLYKIFDPFNNPTSGIIELPQGTYNLIAFNNTIGEFEGSIGFTGTDSWSTFTAYAVTDLDRTAKLGGNDNDPIVKELDTLAIERFMGLNVTTDMINYYHDRPDGNIGIAKTIELSPKRVISMFHVKVHVKGLKYAKNNTIALLRGMAGAYYPGLDKYSSFSVTHMFNLNSRIYDDITNTDGTISASLLTFGIHERESNPDAKYYLDLIFTLINGQKYSVSFDITDKLKVSEDVQIELNLDLEIELPTIIGEDGGFDIDVDDWDEEVVVIPI
jgi:hypothetical protein